ncbi:class I SAM-dependent methyltransferase [Botrimarina mediterranea]|uniref:class I SAM-dependent methyltransferase n=1 Tax=Botrimarina mediterranea TaxID=2528022 RepID=UPI00118AAECD|nr:ubiquinone/menaquinone biosynthesis methyltransferase [Planctomycetes bacterium K2D]
MQRLPDWRLPPGVPRGAWDYTQLRSIADDYDAYHADNPLFAFEESVLAETFGEPPTLVGGVSSSGVIADLGCGSGRALLPLMRRGWRGLAIDLSDAMLDVVRAKADAESLPVECVCANLVEMTPDLVADESADHAMCLFSTLGMIRGREHRLTALRHMRRILKPGGKLVLHVHNFWFNLRDPGGPWWALRSLAKGAVGKGGYETGDKTYPYRGVPNFFLHVFRERELRRDLCEANLKVLRWLSLDVARRHALPRPWLLPSLRTNGWIIVCQKE